MDDWSTLVKRIALTFEDQGFQGTIKFSMDNGRNVHVANKSGQIVITEDTSEAAQAELKMTMADAAAVVNRKLSPTKAIMMLRLKVKGDMSQAIRVAGYFKRPLPADIA